MAVTAQMVKELREMTGAGMMDCKKALVEVDGNLEAAVDYLKEKGLAKAAKKEMCIRDRSRGIQTSRSFPTIRSSVTVRIFAR